MIMRYSLPTVPPSPLTTTSSSSSSSLSVSEISEREICSCLQLGNPIASQTLLSYTFSSVNEWKLESWKVIYHNIAVINRDFILPVKEVKTAVNNIFKRYGVLHILPEETLQDVSRGLVNNRSLLLKDVLMNHISSSGVQQETSGAYNALLEYKRETVKLGAPSAVPFEESGILSRALSAVGNSVFSYFIGLSSSDYSSSLSSSSSSSSSEAYIIRPERQLPYKQPYSLAGIPLDQTVVVVSYIESLVKEFFHSVEQKTLQPPALSSSTNDKSKQTFLILISSVSSFLQQKIKLPVSPDHINIFCWFLLFLSPAATAANARMFSCSLASGPIAASATASGGSSQPLIRAMKVTLNCASIDDYVEVTDADKALIMENFAKEILSDRIIELQKKITAADEECKRCLKSSAKDAALLQLKKKKMFESQVDSLQQQLLKVEEAQFTRDKAVSLGAVAHALQSSAKAVRASMGETREVIDMMEDIKQESSANEKKLNEALSLIATSPGLADISSESLEEEYNRLLTEEVQDSISAAPEAPQHPLQQQQQQQQLQQQNQNRNSIANTAATAAVSSADTK